MQRLYVARPCTSLQDGVLQKTSIGRVRRECRLRFLRRYTRVLSVNPHGQFGGTVIPPCDFHLGLMENAVNKGLPP